MLYFDKKVRQGNTNRKMEDDNMSLPASRQQPKLEVVPNSDAESDSEADVLSIGNVLSNISNKKATLTIIPLVCEHKTIVWGTWCTLCVGKSGIGKCWGI